jgi:hypothetical protein
MPVNEQEVSISSDIPGVIFQPKTSNDGKLFLSTGSIPTTEGEYIISFTIGDIVSNDLSIYVYPNELRYNVTGTN